MRRYITAIAFLLLGQLSLTADYFTVGGVEFSCRMPKYLSPESRIMVLFGGRNWNGRKTLDTFKFDDLADKYSLILVSPSFAGDDYWEPKKWSGKLLKRAVSRIAEKYSLRNRKVFLYGYSAGGQCSALFYEWMPSDVEAWGLHACGVYPDIPVKNGVPAFATCGLEDSDRMRISKAFIYKYRESGGRILWREYKGGHELNAEALDFARQFFSDILDGNSPMFVGEDDTGNIVPAKKASEIDVEFRNYLTSEAMKKLWEAK